MKNCMSSEVVRSSRLSILAVVVSLGLCGPAAAQAVMEIAGDNVGIGTSTPSQTLHLYTDGATIRVEDTTATVGPRTLFKLVNSGKIRFAMEDASTGLTWVFQQATTGNFNISKGGTGFQEFSLDGSGNLVIAGALTEDSDRNAKKDIDPVDSREVLDRVLGLQIAEWRYRDDELPVRHMGPMAQDFHHIFGLGSGPLGLSTLDTSGVALAAIQGLHELVREKDEVITELEERLTKLEALVSASQPGL